MNLNDYQQAARAFATGGGLTFEYALLGLAEEAGEACGKAAKYIRKANLASLANVEKEPMMLELGDCLWMVANAAASLGLSLEDVAAANLRKLEGRKERGTIIGEGDNR